MSRTMKGPNFQYRVSFKLGQGSLPVFVSLNQKFILLSALLNNSSFFAQTACRQHMKYSWENKICSVVMFIIVVRFYAQLKNAGS